MVNAAVEEVWGVTELRTRKSDVEMLAVILLVLVYSSMIVLGKV